MGQGASWHLSCVPPSQVPVAGRHVRDRIVVFMSKWVLFSEELGLFFSPHDMQHRFPPFGFQHLNSVPPVTTSVLPWREHLGHNLPFFPSLKNSLAPDKRIQNN